MSGSARDKVVYAIEFHVGDTKNTPYFVWSPYPEDIQRFVQQHNLSKLDIKWMILLDEDRDEYIDIICPEYYAETYKFQSAQDRKVYTVITTREFLSKAVDDVADELSDALQFGPAALRGEISIFRTVVDLVDSLPYSAVLDADIADTLHDSYEMGSERHDYDPYDPDFMPDRTFTFNSMHDTSLQDGLQPITLETYVRTFTAFFNL